MKKFTRDDTTKIVLGAVMFIFVVYAYFEFLLNPLGKDTVALNKEDAELTTKINEAKKTAQDLRRTETNAKNATEIFVQIKELTQKGSPVAWVPLRTRDFFARYDVKINDVRPAGSVAAKELELPDFIDTRWEVDIPNAQFFSLGNAISAHENSHPLAEFEEVRILSSPDDPGSQRVTLIMQLRIYDHK